MLIKDVRGNFLASVGREVEFLVWCTGVSGGGEDDGEKSGGWGIDHVEGVAAGLDVEGVRGGGANVTGEVQIGRMDVASVLRGAVEVSQRTAAMVCAPGSMADEATRQTIKCLGDGFRVELVEETFAW